MNSSVTLASCASSRLDIRHASAKSSFEIVITVPFVDRRHTNAAWVGFTVGQLCRQGSAGNVRQLVSRARKHIADGRRMSVSQNEQRRFLEAFIAAAQNGDMAGLEGLFAENVVSYSDGGGLVRAAGVPVSGRKRVAIFIAAVSTWCWKGVRLDWVETNGQASVLIVRDGVPIGLTIDASAEGISEIMWFLRPSKLAAISKSVQQLGDRAAPGPAAA